MADFPVGNRNMLNFSSEKKESLVSQNWTKYINRTLQFKIIFRMRAIKIHYRFETYTCSRYHNNLGFLYSPAKIPTCKFTIFLICCVVKEFRIRKSNVSSRSEAISGLLRKFAQIGDSFKRTTSAEYCWKNNPTHFLRI